MTATQIDRGSTETTTIYSEGGDLVFDGRSTRQASRSGRHSPIRPSSPRWWGPHGTTATVVEMDVRPGGRLATRGHGPRTDEAVAFYREYLEVEPPTRFRLDLHVRCRGGSAPGGAGDVHVRGRTATGRRSPRSVTWARGRPWRARSPAAPSRVPSGPGTASGSAGGELTIVSRHETRPGAWRSNRQQVRAKPRDRTSCRAGRGAVRVGRRDRSAWARPGTALGSPSSRSARTSGCCGPHRCLSRCRCGRGPGTRPTA